MKHIHEVMAGDAFARHCGIELVSAGPGHAITRLAVEPQHLNSVGITQGGALFTLADFAFAAASNAHGTVALGINVSITYLKATSAGVLTAEARELSRNARLASYMVNITDESGDLVAVFQGLVYRKREPIS